MSVDNCYLTFRTPPGAGSAAAAAAGAAATGASVAPTCLLLLPPWVSAAACCARWTAAGAAAASLLPADSDAIHRHRLCAMVLTAALQGCQRAGASQPNTTPPVRNAITHCQHAQLGEACADAPPIACSRSDLPDGLTVFSCSDGASLVLRPAPDGGVRPCDTIAAAAVAGLASGLRPLGCGRRRNGAVGGGDAAKMLAGRTFPRTGVAKICVCPSATVPLAWAFDLLSVRHREV